MFGVFLILAHYLTSLTVLFYGGQIDAKTIVFLCATALTTTGYEAMSGLELTPSLQLFQIYQVCVGLFIIMAVVQGLINMIMYHIVTKKLKNITTQGSFLKRHKFEIAGICFSIFWIFTGTLIISATEDFEICRYGSCEKPNFTLALWFAIMSASTVGLGDYLPKSSSMLYSIFLSFWLLIGALVFTPSMVVLSRPLGTWLFPESDMEFMELIESTMMKKEDAKAMIDLAKKTNISKHAFLASTLAKRNLVDQQLIDNILKQFDELDTNEDGSLDYAEVLAWLEVEEEKRKRLVRNNIRRKWMLNMFSVSRLKTLVYSYKRRKTKKLKIVAVSKCLGQ